MLFPLITHFSHTALGSACKGLIEPLDSSKKKGEGGTSLLPPQSVTSMNSKSWVVIMASL